LRRQLSAFFVKHGSAKRATFCVSSLLALGLQQASGCFSQILLYATPALGKNTGGVE